MTLLAEGPFEITLDRRECAWPKNTVFLTQPFVDTLTTTMCQEPIGRVWSYPDTFPAGTVFRLEFTSGVTNGPGELFLSGGYPEWTVDAEDLFDTDNNDFTLLCTAISICNLLARADTVSDQILLNDSIQHALKKAWRNSNAGGTNAREQGGYIYRTPSGDLRSSPFGSNTSPSLCTATFDGSELSAITSAGNTFEGYFHTHPFTVGTPVPTSGACRGITTSGLVFGDGPSARDIQGQATSPKPGYILDSDHVHRLETDFSTVPPNVVETIFDRDPNCL